MSTLQKRFLSMIALCVLGGAGAYAVLWQQDETAQKKETKRAEQAVFSVRDIQEVKTVSLEGPKQTINFNRNEQGSWMIQSPTVDEADQAAVNSLLRYMLGAKRVREVGDEKDGVVTPPSELGLYSLDKPQYRFAFTTLSGESQELLIGRETRFDKNIYAKRASGPEVFLIEYGLQFQYERDLDGFRDKRFLELPVAKVQKLSSKSSKSSWALEKRDGKFWLQEPVEALADQDQVEGILGVLESLEIKEFLTEPQMPPAQLKSRVEVNVTLEDGEETKLNLYGYDQGQDAMVYAQADGSVARKSQAFLQVDGALARLQLHPDNLEDRRVARFDKESVTGIRIFKDDLSMLFTKTDNGFWRLDGESRQVKPGVIQGLLYNLRRLQADRLGVQNPNDEQLETLGLKTKSSGIEILGPNAESQITLYLGTKTSDGFQTALSSLGRLDWVKQSDLLMLHFEAEPYLLPAPK